jgi:phospholipase C
MIGMAKFRACSIVGMIVFLLVLCGCQGLVSGPTTTTPPPTNLGINSINHIVFMAQENRSFDTYFGQLPSYWAANGFASQQFDGMPAAASNPSFDGTTTVSAFHVATGWDRAPTRRL